MTSPPPAPAARFRTWLANHTTAVAVAVLALVSYGPALLSSPGRMPADTKLYLSLDPGGLLTRAPSTFEPDQFAGWVPHQQITYLWPSGPWFWLFDALGVPDWVAHRLWIATIMFLAGAGVLWMVRQIGLRGAAALAAALTYQLSPYLLPYISRTSLLLLPWAGLGWIVGLTVRATARSACRGSPGAAWRARLTPWREPALIALVVATVGSVNATALVLIAPAPVLWLVHAAWARLLTWRAATWFALRTAALCLVVSLWWIAMLLVQARSGAPVLAYSETLTDVSRNSTGSEVLRSLGYWLFYVRDPYGPTTSASLDYLVSTRTMAVSYAVTLLGLAGIALTASVLRRFAGLLVVTGMVLAVGVHPIGSSSPLMSMIAADDDSGIALALRSSTRAVPLLVLGLALGIGSLIAAVPSNRPVARWPALPRTRTIAAAAVVLVVFANLASLWRFELVDQIIDRDESPPAAWIEAADALDQDADRGGDGGTGRVLQLPGAEFGAFRWGYTVDQPLVGMSGRRLVTRDLLPLGSAGAMDLLYALDDRFQEGTIEVAAVAPVARLLGADTVWVANDAEFERFRTPRPEIVDAVLRMAADVGPPRTFGTPFVIDPTVPMVDPTSLSDDRVGTPIEPVVLLDIDDPVGVVRAKGEMVIVAGSGDGLLDAAAAGLLSGHELVRYSGSLTADELDELIGGGTALIITDSNRDRAHHWRGSQDVHGYTEPGGAGDGVLVASNADQRLDVFGSDAPAIQTIAVQQGPVTAIASAYGEPFAYLPEHRAVMAVDGDPASAWLVGGHGDPLGEHIRLGAESPSSSLTMLQPALPPGGRRISDVTVTLDGETTLDVALTDASTVPPGQVVDLPAPATMFDVEITAVTTGNQGLAASRAAVGFAELDLGLGTTTEVIRPPTVALSKIGEHPVAVVLTRLRHDPLDRWRSDPEAELSRSFTLPAPRSFDAAVTLRLDRRATDETLLALTGRSPVASADRRLAGAARNGGRAAIDGDLTTSWITPIDGALGATLTIVADGPVGPDLELTQPGGNFAAITALRLDDGRTTTDVVVPPPDEDGRSTIALPTTLDPGPVGVTVIGTDGATTVDRRFGDVVGLPVAVAELAGSGLPTSPIDESSVIARTCTTDLLEIDGTPVALSFETTLGRLLDGEPVEATPCDGALVLVAGEHGVASTGRAGTGLTVDRVVLSDGATGSTTDGTTSGATGSDILVTVERDDARHRVVTVAGCPDGCWLVLGEGFNDAWSARLDDESLGDPVMVDGGFTGWRLPAAAGPVTVDITWTAQRPVTVALLLSGIGVVLCLAVVALTRGRVPELAPAEPSTRWSRPVDRRRTAIVATVVLVVSSTLLIGPLWGLIGLVVGGGMLLLVRYVAHPAADRALELAGLSGAALVALAAIVINRRNRPPPNAGWTVSFDQLNGLALFSIVCLAVGALSWSVAAGRSGGSER